MVEKKKKVCIRVKMDPRLFIHCSSKSAVPTEI